MITSVPDADTAMREAHGHVYRWPEWFAGFHAELVLDGAGGHSRATLRVVPDGVPEVDFTEIAVDDRGWVAEQIASLVSHRRPLAYEDADGAHAKRVEPIGPEELVVAVDDGLDSRYWLEGGRIARIERNLGQARLSIVIHDRVRAEDGEIASDMTVFTRDPESGRVRRLEILRDEHVTIGDVTVPARRRSLLVDEEGRVTTRDLRLVGHSTARAEAVS